MFLVFQLGQCQLSMYCCEEAKTSTIIVLIQLFRNHTSFFWQWKSSHFAVPGKPLQTYISEAGTGSYMYQVIHIHDKMSPWFKELFLRKSLIRKGFKKSNILDLYIDLVKSSNKRDIIRIDNNGTSAIGKKLLKKITGFSHRNIYLGRGKYSKIIKKFD